VTPTYLVETSDEIHPEWFEGKECIGVTSGASTDQSTIDEVVDFLTNL
jgi:4-hydroxy-3-methylbut-2-enyl diphosphate reductase